MLDLFNPHFGCPLALLILIVKLVRLALHSSLQPCLTLGHFLLALPRAQLFFVLQVSQHGLLSRHGIFLQLYLPLPLLCCKLLLQLILKLANGSV